MILNLHKLDLSQKSTWSALADRLDALGYNLKVLSGNRAVGVLCKASGIEVGQVTKEMIEDEELDYILNFRLNLTKPPSSLKLPS